MAIKIYRSSPTSSCSPLQVKHGQGRRENFHPGHAYKCLPLTEANRYGYDLYVDEDIDVEWKGGCDIHDVIVHSGPAKTHFGIGTFTIDGDGDIWKTPVGYDLMIIPVPNSDHIDQFVSLTALIEADWLHYPWFLSVRLTRPSRILIEKETPLARAFAFKRLPDYTLPEIIPFSADDPVQIERDKWTAERGKRSLTTTPKSKFHFLYKKNMQRRIKVPKE